MIEKVSVTARNCRVTDRHTHTHTHTHTKCKNETKKHCVCVCVCVRERERERERERKWSIGEIRKWGRPKEGNMNERHN